MRLDRYLTSVTSLSRKQARQQIRASSVRVNAEVRSDPRTHVRPDDCIELNGRPLRQAGLRYFMLHKPADVVCANRDAHHVTAIDLISDADSDQLQIAGRLDKDTTGLLLLTDDGQWNHRLTSPRHEHPKVYEVETLRPINDETIASFAQGLLLAADERPTRPADLTRYDKHRARLVLREGRYHQVKRMFEASGNRVVKLHRSAIGSIILDETLAPGDYRPLTPQEVDSIQ